jgi:glycosyltransferase involved in cell wall biosynthesis
MLPGSGVVGPQVRAVRLPAEVPAPDSGASDQVRAALGVDDRPIVLCVGSHEPRKNHLAVLHAARLQWTRGDDFSLVFVGGNAWASAEFEATVTELREAGRAVHTVRALSDDLLFAAYRSARLTVFPSLIEGFGLPVAESIACGTPVITSDYGSMAELAEGGGTVLVDPRDDHGIADALHRLLSDDDLHAWLAGEAAARPVRTWDDYARDTWDYLVGFDGSLEQAR